jgi:hypothetical protein
VRRVWLEISVLCVTGLDRDGPNMTTAAANRTPPAPAMIFWRRGIAEARCNSCSNGCFKFPPARAL